MTISAIPQKAALITGQRFEVEHEVRVIKTKLKVRDRSNEQKDMLGIISIAFPVFAVVSGVIIATDIQGNANDIAAMAGLLIGGLATLLLLCLLLVRRYGTPATNAANTERKDQQRSIKRSIKVARDSGDAVPVLTKEHVEAGFRFDSIMLAYEPEMTSADERAIRALHLSDLSREAAIFSLIGERGLTTFDEVTTALAEMESNKKPLQNGWL